MNTPDENRAAAIRLVEDELVGAKREARDYFYMTLRHVLPGANVAPVVASPAVGSVGFAEK